MWEFTSRFTSNLQGALKKWNTHPPHQAFHFLKCLTKSRRKKSLYNALSLITLENLNQIWSKSSPQQVFTSNFINVYVKCTLYIMQTIHENPICIIKLSCKDNRLNSRTLGFTEIEHQNQNAEWECVKRK